MREIGIEPGDAERNIEVAHKGASGAIIWLGGRAGLGATRADLETSKEDNTVHEMSLLEKRLKQDARKEVSSSEDEEEEEESDDLGPSAGKKRPKRGKTLDWAHMKPTDVRHKDKKRRKA